jgi:hypothetical protein
VILAQCVVYLARAPKSIEIYQAYGKAKACVKHNKGPLPSVPLHLRNASTKLMKNLGKFGVCGKKSHGVVEFVCVCVCVCLFFLFMERCFVIDLIFMQTFICCFVGAGSLPVCYCVLYRTGVHTSAVVASQLFKLACYWQKFFCFQFYCVFVFQGMAKTTSTTLRLRNLSTKITFLKSL